MAQDASELSSWSYLRATLITLALLSQCVSALPDKPLTQEKLARPEAQRALDWLGRLPGVADPRAQLITWSERGVAARGWFLKPFAPLIAATGSRQQWNLFLSVGDEAYRMRIDAQTADENWQLVYRANQLDVLQLAPLLNYRRLRAIYNPNKYGTRPSYAALTERLCERVLHDHPEYTALRVSMERLHIGERNAAARVLDTRYAVEHTRAELP